MAYESDAKFAEILAASTTLTAAVNTRLGAIAGIDRGTIYLADTSAAVSATATVTAVVTARSLLTNLGQRTSLIIPDADDPARRGTLALTNTTTITFNIGSVTTTAESVTVSYELVEYAA